MQSGVHEKGWNWREEAVELEAVGWQFYQNKTFKKERNYLTLTSQNVYQLHIQEEKRNKNKREILFIVLLFFELRKRLFCQQTKQAVHSVVESPPDDEAFWFLFLFYLIVLFLPFE